MKGLAILSALAALAVASPTRTLEEPPTKRSKLPAVTASGNGKYMLFNTRFYERKMLTCLCESILC